MLKNRRNIKKQRKDTQDHDSPSKGGDEILLQDDDVDSGLFGQGRRESTPRAGFINKNQSLSQNMKYQPLEETKSNMSANAREKLQGNIAALLGTNVKPKLNRPDKK